MLLTSPLDACGSCCLSEQFKKITQGQRKSYLPATFIRVHDLNLTDEDRVRCASIDECRSDVGSGGGRTTTTTTTTTSGGGGIVASNNSNRGDVLSIETDGSGAIMNALVVIGLEEATDESNRWTPTGATDRILRRRAKQGRGCGGGPWANAASAGDVLVWSSKCVRGGHGSDYPVVKARGLIPASARDVIDLVRDSNRVREYNKMSIGREDQLSLTTIESEDYGDGGGSSSSVHPLEVVCHRLGIVGQAKVMCSKSQPPLTLKPLEFKTLNYARRLDPVLDDVELEGSGAAYVTVGRSTWETNDGKSDGSDDSSTRCEILLCVNLVRDVVSHDAAVDGRGAWCELTLITHAVSPGIPIFMGKQMGLVAAENYIKDIRALFER